MQRKSKLAAALLLAVPLSLGALAQSDTGIKQDTKDAANSTKSAAKKTGHKIKRGTKKAAHKSAQVVRKGSEKVEDKTAPPQ